MKRIPVIMIFLSLVLYGKAENPPSDKDKAVACIKRWEGWHRGKMPYIGYGHRLLPHETLTENLSEAQADSLLRHGFTGWSVRGCYELADYVIFHYFICGTRTEHRAFYKG